jgi:hypothetical protein
MKLETGRSSKVLKFGSSKVENETGNREKF